MDRLEGLKPLHKKSLILAMDKAFLLVIKNIKRLGAVFFSVISSIAECYGPSQREVKPVEQETVSDDCT